VAASDEEEPMTTALQVPGYPDISIPDRQEWTVEYLASLPEDLRYELIDGRLILPSPSVIHQHIGMRMCLAMEVDCPPDLIVVPDMSLKIDYRNEPCPDIVVARLGHAEETPLPVEDAVLAVEIVSPTSHVRDTYAKLRAYAAAGVPRYWIVDPLYDEGIVLSEYRCSAGGVYELVSTTDKVFTTEEPYPITIDLPALTTRRNAILERTRARG
jgi:Uma2 family endonuclease